MAREFLNDQTPCPDLDYEDFLSEVQDIEENTEGDDDAAEDEVCKTPDEGEAEKDWLKATGLDHLAAQFEDDREVDEESLLDETSTLPSAQRVAIKKRVDTLNATVRKRLRQQAQSGRDVRDIFQDTAPSSHDHATAVGGPPSPNEPRYSHGVQMRAHPDTSSASRTPPRPSSGKVSREVSLLRYRGGYTLAGESGSRQEATDSGIETLSIQSKAKVADGSKPTIQIIRSMPLAESDVALAFGVDDLSPNSPRTPVFPSSPDTYRKVSKEDADASAKVIMRRDSLGVTSICDLGKGDRDKVRQQSLLSLTALFDMHNIEFTRRKSKKKFKDTGVFGVPLHILLENNQRKFQNTHLEVPEIIIQLIRFLEEKGIAEEGILRVPGSLTRIQALRQEMEEKFHSGQFSWEDVRANDAAGLLKQFLRDLPVPLLTFECLEAFAQVDKIRDVADQVKALNLLVLQLPDVNSRTLQMLLRFLRLVAAHVDNKMTLNNVAMIMAPNLFLVQSSRGRGQNKGLRPEDMWMAAGTATIMRLMIEHAEELWTVPQNIMVLIRELYETEQRRPRDKSLIKLLGRKDKADSYKKPNILNESDFNRGVIRVQAPTMTKCNTTVQLDPSTTARDIVSRFQGMGGSRTPTLSVSTIRSVPPPSTGGGHHSYGGQPNGRHDGQFEEKGSEDDSKKSKDPIWDNTHLYEVGGNIGERKLDPKTNMIALYQTNPNAEWIIRTNHYS